MSNDITMGFLQVIYVLPLNNVNNIKAVFWLVCILKQVCGYRDHAYHLMLLKLLTVRFTIDWLLLGLVFIVRQKQLATWPMFFATFHVLESILIVTLLFFFWIFLLPSKLPFWNRGLPYLLLILIKIYYVLVLTECSATAGL